MRRLLGLVALSLAICTAASAAGWKKPYFGATKPGTWARYAEHTTDTRVGDTTTTLMRLADDGDRPRFEMKIDSEGKFPLVINQYTLKKGFAVDHDLIDYGPAIVAESSGDGTAELQQTDAATVALIAGATPPYGPTAKFKGTETIDGKNVDHYTYLLKRPGNATETGDLWLSDAVPFGVVRNTFVIKDAEGDTTTFDRKLAASGAGDVPPLPPPPPANPQP